MADKIRIYQLAKELGVESKTMLTILDDMGVDYKTHSSSLDSETAETVRQLVAESGGKPADVVAAAGESGADEAIVATPEPTPPTEEPAATKVASDAPLRAPVVTVMGHVDHGKTSLLDFIRQTAVAEHEAGGITQHIGAYQADTAHGIITFLDTPGHEAFTTIRQRGANATDIAVIVVAADDSIMPQTREAIAHARAAKVPIIVAVNKIDLPQANPAKVKQDLIQVELVPEEFGGDTIVVELSATTGQGVKELLEMISLVAEVEDLRASPDGPARGIVIESILDRRAGVLATILVQEGQLSVGDIIESGEVWARVRRLTDSAGNQLREAGPSVPVQVLGFSDQPSAGELVNEVDTDATAKARVSERRDVREREKRKDIGKKGITLADLYGKPKAKVINLLLRADTQGSLEAIRGVIERESDATEEVDVEIMQALVGAPNESDLLLASTAEASIITFGVTLPGGVKKAAERKNVPLRSYRIIYQLIDDVQRMIRGQIEPEFEENVIGHAEIRLVINVPRSGTIAGSYVTDGVVRRGAKARLTREGREVYKGSIASLKRFKDDAREVGQGFECGINLQNYDNVQEGDVIEIYEMVEVAVG